MVNGIRCVTLSLCLSLVWSSALASESSDLKNDPLAKRCLGIFEIYKDNNLETFLSEFSDEWIAILGVKVFKKQLETKHDKWIADYDGSPKEILIKSIENIPPHPKEVEMLGVEETKMVSIYIDGNHVSRVDGCKFNRIKTKWYFRETPL
ncbi:MAG: hypothetical protein ACI89T_001699 [Cognaticolwellia sp.]|jgi:hypothetical protein